MKILYVSLLSLAIIGQGAHFYYDYQTKQRQAEAENAFREKHDAALNQLSAKTDNAIAELKQSSSKTFEDALKSTEARLNRQTEERLAEAKRQTEEQATKLQEFFTSTQQELTETRQQTESQTNLVIAGINKLRLDSLAKIPDSEPELSLVKIGRSGISDQEFIKRQKQKSLDLFNPEHHG